MLSRSPFKKPSYVHKRVYPSPIPPEKRRNAVMAPSVAHEAQPKEAVKAKPGKYTPTVEESDWMSRIVAHGCIACILDGCAPRETAVHHILRGGRRIGHLFTLPLCQPGHHMDGQQFGMVSRHPFKARFEQRYGTELELLEVVRARINHTGELKCKI